MPGKVLITLQNVVVRRKEDQFKSMSPWAVVMFDGQKKTTQVIENGNLEPQFNEQWIFQRNSDVKITVSLFKKEFTYDAIKYQKETDLLIGKGTLNILSTLKRAQKQPASIVIDLVYDFDNKIAGQAYLSIQFTPGTNIEEYRSQEQEKQMKKEFNSSLKVQNISLTLDAPNNQAAYYIKVRNPNCSNNTPHMNSAKSMLFQGSYDEIIRDSQIDMIVGDDLFGISILDLDKIDPSQTKQSIPVKKRGKQIGTITCQIKYESWKQEEVQEELPIMKLSNEEIKEQIKNLEKKDRFWISPERFQLDQQLKKKAVLDRRQMLMKHRSSLGSFGTLGNESSLFSKSVERNLYEKPDIIINTTTVKLPKLVTNNHVEVPTQYNKSYLRNIHGGGFSTIESSSTLQKSVPKFSIPESQRFIEPKEKFPGPGEYGTSGVANDSHVAKKFKKVTAISEIRTTKQERKARVGVDTGLKKDQLAK